MKVLLFGGSGQLGQEFLLRAKDLNFSVVYPSPQELDITEQAQVEFLVGQAKPDVVLNCAAYTAVDLAETEQKLCYSINRDGAMYIAKAAKKQNARVVHISTDYVFAGDGNTPLKETDATDPQSIYGKSKLEGELAVMQETNGEAAIVRTASLHGKFGNNFVHTMLSLFDKKTPVSVVQDQLMSPCWAGFLAESLLDIIRVDFSGVLHCACSGVASWYDFASAIAEYSYSPTEQPVITPTTRDKFVRPAPRPAYSAFDLSKFSSVLGRKPISWQDGLKYHLQQIDRLAKNKKRGAI
jgi:dTDP-4-dehydrorhamnose reductase